MRTLLLGIDSGTQSTKVLVVDARDGKVVASAAQGHDLLPNLPPGAKEQHPHTWRGAATGAIRRALRQAKAVAAEVKAIGVSGQQHGFVPLDKAGEVIRLPEGRYRVESRSAAGNAAAVTDVDVKAGRVSTVGMTIKAGLARLSFVGSPEAQVMWNVEDQRGTRIALSNGLTANLLLIPGTYTARAVVGPELLTATFRIAAGETRDILLGN